jgi:A/G-specific adenine glycosylase
MLQQTTVEAVRRRFGRFLERFPDLASLARAREDAVLAAWSGLGYYARARNLRKAAREIVRRHGGTLPADPAILRGLPGFGDYMSSAVAAIAFGRREPAADANVTRVVSRLFALPGRAGSARLRAAVLARVSEILPADRPGEATAALMDLGQAICTPRRPDCPRCPVAADCQARWLGRPGAYPRRSKKPRPVRIPLAAAFLERDGRALLLRRRAGFLAGMWEFPCGPARTGSPRAARARLSLAIGPWGLTRDADPAARVRHTVVNRRLEIEVFRATGSPRLPKDAPPMRWFTPGDLDRAAIPTLTRKIARSVGFLPASNRRKLSPS